MSGANVERTSWVAEGVKGDLRPVWYKAVEPLIPAKAQIITSAGKLFVSTARGLLALYAANGAEAWFYATELPLGNSPTISNNTAYVGGMDKRIHAVDINSGQRLWTFQADAGFDTNPVVVEGKVFMGSRDGTFYAVYADSGQLAWKYKTGASIHFSAAYKNGVLFFASNDSHAYALRASDGSLVWKSAALPGSGFYSWWPMIYQNYVILTGTSGYRTNIGPASGKDQFTMEQECLLNPKPSGTFPLGVMVDNVWMDNSDIQDCLERYPDRRTYFVLDQANGNELTMDTDRDGKPEYAPIFWFGTHAGNRYPAIMGSDGSVYQAMPFSNWSHMFRGQVGGWRLGSQMVNLPTSSTLAIDEPIAYSAGGSVIYWNHCCDRGAGAFDLSVLDTGVKQEWRYFSYDLNTRAPGYNEMYTSVDIDMVYGGNNGMYGSHGDQNPPIPYKGMVFMHRSNAIIAFGNPTGAAVKLPTFRPPPVEENIPVDVNVLTQTLVNEVTKVLDAGHLRPGYGVSGNFNLTADFDVANKLMDNWASPSASIDTLLRALPYLPADLQARTRTYIQNEWTQYPPYSVTHIGWNTGAPRESWVLPNDINAAMAASPASTGPNNYNFREWEYPPQRYYTMWKYFQTFGNNKAIFDANRNKLGALPADSVLIDKPHVNNAYIAGYWGYLELEKMSGYPETASIRSTLNHLLDLRASTFSKDSPYGPLRCDAGGISAACYSKSLNVSRNFMFLTPELANYLHDNALNKVQEAVDEYNRVAPYWFATKYEQTYAEGVFQPIEDSNAVLQARALILRQPYSQLVKYLDAPVVERGDYYYMQNLVSVIEASGR